MSNTKKTLTHQTTHAQGLGEALTKAIEHAEATYPQAGSESFYPIRTMVYEDCFCFLLRNIGSHASSDGDDVWINIYWGPDNRCFAYIPDADQLEEMTSEGMGW